MRLIVKELGPIRDESTVDFGDITVIMGPPNSGKSYTLRGLYLSLIYTNPHFLERILNRFGDDLSNKIRKKVSDKIDELLCNMPNNVNKRPLKFKLIYNIEELKGIIKKEYKIIENECIPIRDNTKIKIDDVHALKSVELSKIMFSIMDGINSSLKPQIKVDGIIEISELLISIKTDDNNENLIIELSINYKILSNKKIESSIYNIEKIRFKLYVDKKLESILKNISKFDITNVNFIPFGRSSIVYLALEDSKKYRIPSSMHLLYSYIKDIRRNVKKLYYMDNKNIEIILKIFAPVLQGNISYDKFEKRIRYKKWGTNHELPIELSSALAGEVSGILLPLLNLPKKSVIIIEEPEAQLHYSAQVLMALTLISLSSKLNYKIVVSTHSDVFALTLAYITKYKPNREKVLSLIKNIFKLQNITVEEKELYYLVDDIYRINHNNDNNEKDEHNNCNIPEVKFYYYKPEINNKKISTKIINKKPEEIISNVPGITEVIDILMDWAIDL